MIEAFLPRAIDPPKFDVAAQAHVLDQQLFTDVNVSKIHRKNSLEIKNLPYCKMEVRPSKKTSSNLN